SNASIVKFLSKSLSIEEPKEINNNDEIIDDIVEDKKDELDEFKNEEQSSFEFENIDKNSIKIESEKNENYETLNQEQGSYEDVDINIDYLEDTENNISQEVDDELKIKKDLLQKTLDNFKVKATIKNVEKGPAVTRYEVEPDKGVKVSKILNLSDDIALALATSGIRIEAPIPGKSLVGIEVPNDVVST